MAKQFYFTVFYDTETDSFEIDYDTQEAFFHGNPVFDTELQDWVALEDSDWEEDNTDYNRSADALYLAIKDLRTIPTIRVREED